MIDFDHLSNNSLHVVTELPCRNGDDVTTTADMRAALPARRDSAPAVDAAHRMRAVMAQDVDEFDMADCARALTDEIGNELLHAAWGILQSHERSAWKALLKLERIDHDN